MTIFIICVVVWLVLGWVSARIVAVEDQITDFFDLMLILVMGPILGIIFGFYMLSDNLEGKWKFDFDKFVRKFLLIGDK